MELMNTGEVLSDQRRVPQENDAIVWYRTNLQSLFNRFPQERRIIGNLFILCNDELKFHYFRTELIVHYNFKSQSHN